MASTREDRKHKRLAIDIGIDWKIDSHGLRGEGKLADVSLLGASFYIDRVLTVRRSVVFTLHAPDLPALPASARLRWFRRISTHPLTILVGVIFEGAVTPVWSDWVHHAFGRTADDSATLDEEDVRSELRLAADE